MKDEKKSALVQAIEAHERKLFEFDAGAFMGISGKPIGKYKIRVATKAEADRALVAAHRYVHEITGGMETAVRDSDILNDAKTCHILHQACRDSDSPSDFPAFPSPRWMIEHLSTEQIAVLLNHYNECVKQEGPMRTELSNDTVEALASLCVNLSETDLPNAALVQCGREYLSELCIRLSLKLNAANMDLKSARSEETPQIQ